MTVVKMSHVRQAGYCRRGAQAFFQRHNLNWMLFLRDGVSAEKLEQTGDAMALRVVRIARGQP